MDGIDRREGSKIVVGVGDLAISDNPHDVIVTYSLGSCVGVSVWDSQLRVGGIVHCLLPSSRQASDGDHWDPARYVDTGVVELLDGLFKLGARRDHLVVKVAGGGTPLENCGGFRIGERNHAAVRKVLWKNTLLIDGEKVGGADPKTLMLALSDGRVTVGSLSATEEI